MQEFYNVLRSNLNNANTRLQSVWLAPKIEGHPLPHTDPAVGACPCSDSRCTFALRIFKNYCSASVACFLERKLLMIATSTFGKTSRSQNSYCSRPSLPLHGQAYVAQHGDHVGQNVHYVVQHGDYDDDVDVQLAFLPLDVQSNQVSESGSSPPNRNALLFPTSGRVDHGALHGVMRRIHHRSNSPMWLTSIPGGCNKFLSRMEQAVSWKRCQQQG